jgi:hypothetical protein
MHIREKGEELDYDLFFSEGIPQSPSEKWREAIGRRTWGLMHGLIEHYPCPTCREAGVVLVSGIHDVVNIHLNKGVYSPENFENFHDMVQHAWKHYSESKKQGKVQLVHDKPKAQGQVVVMSA